MKPSTIYGLGPNYTVTALTVSLILEDRLRVKRNFTSTQAQKLGKRVMNLLAITSFALWETIKIKI
jgi:hypothetical protein